MADIGAQDGIFEQQESDIISNLLKFRSVLAKDVMTPRTVVRSSAATETLGNFSIRTANALSRIPLYENESRDQVIGYVLKDQVLEGIVDGHTQEPLVSLKREIIAVPLITLFWNYLTVSGTHEQIALVVDEFGGMDGIVTMEDVIVTLLGIEIVDDTEPRTCKFWRDAVGSDVLVALVDAESTPKTEDPDVISETTEG